jgi:multiple sugar transport system permease protein
VRLLADLRGTPAGFALLLAGLLVLAWLLYPRPGGPQAGDARTEIVLWTPPGPFQEASRLVAEAFEARQPGYRVVVGTATARDATGDPSRFLLSVAGGVPPDVILFDRFAIVEWASRGAFADLRPFLDAQHADDPHAVRRENFFAPSWDEAVHEGRLYAIARDADTRALYYNVNELTRAGLVYREGDAEVIAGRARVGQARPPQSWEELLRRKLRASASADADGTVRLGAPVSTAGVVAGDVAVLARGQRLFRARVAEVLDGQRLRLDLVSEQPARLDAVPRELRDDVELRVFDREGYVVRLTRFEPATGRLAAVGFIPLYGSSWFYLFGWQNGGEFLSADGTRCTLDDPRLVEALEWLTDVYDSMGGVIAVTSVQTLQRASANLASGVTDPFLTDRVAMRIDTDSFLNDIATLRPDLAFGVAPAPLPEHQRAAGVEPFGWGGGWAYAIPSTAREKQGAWELIRWMTSPEANRLLAEYEASLARAQGRRHVPRLHSDRRVLEWLRTRFLIEDPTVPAAVREGFDVFVDLMPNSRYRPVTPVGQLLWTEHVRAAANAVNRIEAPAEALRNGRLQVQRALDRVHEPPRGTPVNWGLLIAIYLAGVLALVAALVVVQERRAHGPGGGRRRAWFEGYVCASPWLVGFILFGGGPILFSLVISFCHYDVLNEARFVGFENYAHLLGSQHDDLVGSRVPTDPLFWTSLKNTAFMLLGLPLMLVAGLGLAVLLDSKVRGMTFYRTVYYLPAIVPAVAGFILWSWLFDPGRGLVNQALMSAGVAHPPRWLDDSAWSKPSLILMSLWAVGGSMIVWLAGLKDIPESLLEAASVDGASRFQRFLFVKLPLLTPYILFNLIIGTIAVLQTFEAAYVMTDGGPADSTMFYAYKLYNEAFRFLDMGVASAMAWLLFLAAMALTLLQLWSSRRWVHYGGA